MQCKYLIRLDDACPTMDSKKWFWVESVLEKYDIRPMVGVIPANNDKTLQFEKEDSAFWEKVHRWQCKRWAIALHGYDHCYVTQSSGINPLWNRSEFAGLSLELQKEKIRKGIEIFKQHDLFPQYFFAPSHTFDENTLTALKTESTIRIISDTIATKPYCNYGFVFIPQIGGRCSRILIPGTWTFCLHPSIMTEKNFNELDRFLQKYHTSFISFDEIDLTNVKPKNFFSKFLSWCYFTQRKTRQIQ